MDVPAVRGRVLGLLGNATYVPIAHGYVEYGIRALHASLYFRGCGSIGAVVEESLVAGGQGIVKTSGLLLGRGRGCGWRGAGTYIAPHVQGLAGCGYKNMSASAPVAVTHSAVHAHLRLKSSSSTSAASLYSHPVMSSIGRGHLTNPVSGQSLSTKEDSHRGIARSTVSHACASSELMVHVSTPARDTPMTRRTLL